MLVVAFDAGMLSILIHPDATIPDDPTTGKPLVDAKRRIAYLIRRLEDQRATILIPTPALAEFLFLVDESGANYLRVLNTRAVFDIKEFDTKADDGAPYVGPTLLAESHADAERLAERVRGPNGESLIVLGQLAERLPADKHGDTKLWLKPPDASPQEPAE
jgi:hypothetical protein